MATGVPALSTLLKKTTIVDHHEVLSAANGELQRSKGDINAQRTKAVALLQLDRYDEAVHFFEEAGNALKKAAQLEHAYALYKSGNLEKAQDIVQGIDENRGALHLKAQTHYRLEEFSQAATIYRSLLEFHQVAVENEENDLRINGSATDAQLEWKKQGELVHKKKATREDLEAFETAYNAACACIARSEFSQAEFLLKKANDLCSLSDLSEDLKSDELLPIKVQQLYVLNTLGQKEEAERLASDITLKEIKELSTRQIAQINKLTASTKPYNPYLSHRIVQSTLSPPKSDRLFEFQKSLTLQNELAFDLLSSKFTGVINTTATFLSAHTSPTTQPNVNIQSVINAAAHAQNQLGKLGLTSILPLIEKRPNDVGLILTILQLYVLTNNHGSAITLLKTFFKHLGLWPSAVDQDVRFAPGLIAVMVSLYSIQGRKSHIRTELAKAASYWRHKSKNLPDLFRAAGLALLDSTSSDDCAGAGEIFETLHYQDPKDKLSAAGYVAAYATTNLTKVESTLEHLSPITRLTAGIDVDALEAAGVPNVPTAAAQNTSKKRAADGSTKPTKKRIRKSKLPKEFDPNKAPDPERWLPLRDRSSYRPKGKKGKQKAQALTQGGVSDKGAESLNIANSDGVSKPGSTVVSASSKPSKKKKSKK
ncbi:Signal recognition particle core component [Xylographa opegraphella]|nr:Signal recognition particle core component [Xylographa opegraphella]